MNDDIPTTREALRSLAHGIVNINPSELTLDGYLPRNGAVVIKRLIDEAASLVRHEFGPRNELVRKLADLGKREVVTANRTAQHLWAQQAVDVISEAMGALDRRELGIPAADVSPPSTQARPSGRRFDERYVSEDRIRELRSICGSGLDPARLVRLLEELNVAAKAESWITVAALVRIVLDHVPPVFGHETFAQVLAHADGRIPSWKQTLASLQETSRKIADHHVHKRMEAYEALPTFQQVDNRKELDQLLERIVVTMRANSRSS